MAIITVGVLILLTIIVMTIVFYIQQTNAIIEYATKQTVYTVSLSQHVDSAIESFFKFNAFKPVEDVNYILGLNDKTTLPSDDESIFYMYYQPLYKDYLTGSKEAKPEYDVRWVWINNYMKRIKNVFPYMKDYVESMKVPSFVRNQTFKYDDKIELYTLEDNSPVNDNPELLKLVPDFYVNDNLLLFMTQNGFKIVTSNYTVEVVSKASVRKTSEGGSDVYFEEATEVPFMITRDIHASEFLLNFRVLQMYNALLFQHLAYAERLKYWTNKYAYLFVDVSGDDEIKNANSVRLYSKLVDKVPMETNEWVPVTLDAYAKYNTYDFSTITSSKIGKYGVPSFDSTKIKQIPSFDWMVYNIVFVPPYSINTKEFRLSDLNMRMYVPFTLYMPFEDSKLSTTMYASHSQWMMMEKTLVNSLLQSTSNSYGADALYLLADMIAHTKNSVFKDGTFPTFTVEDTNGNTVFILGGGGGSQTIIVFDKNGVEGYNNLIQSNFENIPYTGLAWVNVIDNERELKNYLQENSREYVMYNLLFNAYIISHYPDFINFLEDLNTGEDSLFLIKKLTNRLYYNYLAIPYTTQALMISERENANPLYLYVSLGGVPSISSYFNSINFMSENLMDDKVYNNPNIHWSYVRWAIGELRPPESSYKPHSTGGGIYPVAPTTVVYNDPSVDFPDAIQLWWFPTADKIDSTLSKYTVKSDEYDWKTSLYFDENTLVKITESQTAKLVDVVGNSIQLKGDHTEGELNAVKEMYDGISVSRPVITNIEYKVEDVDIHYYYAPKEIKTSTELLSEDVTLIHRYDCPIYVRDCCIKWSDLICREVTIDNETTEICWKECLEEASFWKTNEYGSGSKTKKLTYSFSIYPETSDEYNLRIYQDFDTGYRTIQRIGFYEDVSPPEKIKSTYSSLKNYFTKYFFVESDTTHIDECGCDDEDGVWKFKVDYDKVMLKREELYYVVEVAEVDLKLRITYDLYATDMRFINDYIGLWKQNIKDYPYYNIMYVTEKDDITHISVVGDTVSLLGHCGYPSYYSSFQQHFLSERYLDPNFLIGKGLYVKSKFVVEVPVKVYIITRFWYGTPPRLNVSHVQESISSTGKAPLSMDAFDITYYINDIDNYEAEARLLLPNYYLNPSKLPSYGLPIMIAPNGVIIHKPLGLTVSHNPSFKAYIKGFTPDID